MRMLVTVEFVDAGEKSGCHRTLVVQRDFGHTELGDIGLSLAEGMHLLESVQNAFVDAQAHGIAARARVCLRCGKQMALKDFERRRVHTLFGLVPVPGIRLISCNCDGSPRRAFSPLKGWLTRSSNELRYQAARLGSSHSYRTAAKMLQELLPVHWQFGHVRVRQAVLEVGSRLEEEEELPTIREDRPIGTVERPATMAFDGGYARTVRKGGPRNFEILTGVIQKPCKIKVFATAFPNRAALPERLRRFAASAGVTDETQISVLTDGAASLLRLKAMLPMKTRFVLDYFHVAMKFRHLDQCAGRIPPCKLSPDGSIFELYDRLNYLRAYVWTGRRKKIEESIDILLRLLEQVKIEMPNYEASARVAASHAFALSEYLRANAGGVINYHAWKRDGRRISSSGVEGTVNRLIGRRLGKSQHMCWTKRGAHLLLQVRCALINEELLAVFKRWHREVGERRTELPWEWPPQCS